MTQQEKVHELYYALKPKCEAEGLNLTWEIHRALAKFRKENPDLDKEWYLRTLDTDKQKSQNRKAYTYFLKLGYGVAKMGEVLIVMNLTGDQDFDANISKFRKTYPNADILDLRPMEIPLEIETFLDHNTDAMGQIATEAKSILESFGLQTTIPLKKYREAQRKAMELYKS